MHYSLINGKVKNFVGVCAVWATSLKLLGHHIELKSHYGLLCKQMRCQCLDGADAILRSSCWCHWTSHATGDSWVTDVYERIWPGVSFSFGLVDWWSTKPSIWTSRALCSYCILYPDEKQNIYGFGYSLPTLSVWWWRSAFFPRRTASWYNYSEFIIILSCCNKLSIKLTYVTLRIEYVLSANLKAAKVNTLECLCTQSKCCNTASCRKVRRYLFTSLNRLSLYCQ